MNAAALFAYLSRCDVVLGAHEGKLRYNAPAGLITPALKALMAQHKAELLVLLAEGAREADEERLAIQGEGSLLTEDIDSALAALEHVGAIERVTDPEGFTPIDAIEGDGASWSELIERGRKWNTAVRRRKTREVALGYGFGNWKKLVDVVSDDELPTKPGMPGRLEERTK
jgi:hypothetical protein